MTSKSSDEIGNSTGDSVASRRRFIQGAGTLGGAIVLGLITEAQAQTDTTPAAPATAPPEPQLLLKLNENPELGKLGGWKIVDVGAERVIVANTEDGIVACSAICTHKGCEVEYRNADKQFACPCHGARYDLTGKVLRGPARTNLAQYDAQGAVLVAPKK